MGCSSSKAVKVADQTPQHDEPAEKNDDMNDDEQKICIRKGTFNEPEVKILLLGAGESGKSTISRQLKRLYCGGFTKSDREHFKLVIQINIISDFQLLIELLRHGNEKYPDELDNILDTLIAIDSNDPIDSSIAELISKAWEEPAMKNTFAQCNSSGIAENFDYFLDKIDEISKPDYMPTDLDILKARIRTTGSNDLKIQMNSLKALLVDIGGQKSERKHWEKCFINLDYVIFVQSLSDFDQVLFEDENMPRVIDSLSIWEGACGHNPYLKNLPYILVFNKTDLFKRKIKDHQAKFRESYPDFKGNIDNVEECMEHVKQTFINRVPKDKQGWIQTVFACAMDEKSISDLIHETATHILKDRNML